jgi:hypothetical protein
MKTIGASFGIGVAVGVVALCLAPAGLGNKLAPLPAKVLSAKTVYVDNQTGDAELQNTTYMELAKWGRLQIVDTPKKADVVLRLSGGNSVRFLPAGEKVPTYGTKPANGGFSRETIPAGFAEVEVVEPKSGSPLWSEQRKISGIQAKRRVLEGLREAIQLQEQERNK